MKILILAVGSRGDVQPFVALGRGLQKSGYEVLLAGETSFEEMAREHGLEFAPLRAEFARLAQTEQGKAAVSGKRSLSLMKAVKPMLRNMLDDIWQVAPGSDAVVYHPKALGGYHIAEKLGIPGLLAMSLPAYSPTREFSNPILGGADYGGWLNRLSYDLVTKLTVLPYKGLINAWRKEKLDLPPYKTDMQLLGRLVPKLYAYSEHVLPRPDDWDESTHVTGYWYLPASPNWQPPRELQAFLEAGPPPIYAGFGSMGSDDAEGITRMFVEAARATRQRLLLATGWGGLADTSDPETVFVLQAAPHDWLFPRCAAIIHHGGAGTTGAGLQAGRPTLICPFMADQHFWGRRVHALRFGPQPIPHKQLNIDNLTQAMHLLVTDDKMRQRAAALGEKIRQEDGVEQAVMAINAELGL